MDTLLYISKESVYQITVDKKDDRFYAKSKCGMCNSTKTADDDSHEKVISAIIIKLEIGHTNKHTLPKNTKSIIISNWICPNCRSINEANNYDCKDCEYSIP